MASRNRLVNQVLLQGSDQILVVDGDREFSYRDIKSIFAEVSHSPEGIVSRGPSFVAVTREWLLAIGKPGNPHYTEYFTKESSDRMPTEDELPGPKPTDRPSRATVGAVITFHNQNKYAVQVIESVRNQSRKFSKVVVVDDSSEEAMETCPVDVSKIRVEFKNKCKARNAGAAFLKTEYVVFIDGDNWLTPTFLEELLKETGPNVAMVYPSLAIHNEDGTLNYGAVTPTRPFNPRDLRISNCAETSALIRRSAFDEAGQWAVNDFAIEDWELWIRFMHLGFDMKYCPASVLNYRRVNFPSPEAAVMKRDTSVEISQRIHEIERETDSIRFDVFDSGWDRVYLGEWDGERCISPTLIETKELIAGPIDQWADRIKMGAVPGEFAAVTCFFSPSGFKKPIANYWQFRKAFKGPLYTIECLFGDQTPSIPDALHVRAEDVLWHKEALLNILIRSLPDFVKKVAWVDADLLFPDDWHIQASIALENYPVVQGFHEAISMNSDGSDATPRLGVAAAECFGSQTAFNFSLSHPGFAWAARRSVIEDIGLLDFHFTGGADSLMAFGFFGRDPSSFFREKYNLQMLARMIEWKDEITARIGGNVGFVDCDIRHLWHGSKEDRKYVERIEMLRSIDLDRDLVADGQLWKWADRVPEIKRDLIRDYFASRKEDSK